MSFHSLRRYRLAVFLAGDDIGIPLPVRALRALALTALAWVLTVTTFAVANRFFVGTPAAEVEALGAFTAEARRLRTELLPEAPEQLPALVLQPAPAPEPPVVYRRLASLSDGTRSRSFDLLEVRRGSPGWLFPTARPLETPVSIHPVLGEVRAAALAPVEETGEAGPPVAGESRPVDQEVAARYVRRLQQLYESHLGADLGWQPVWWRRLNGPIQAATVWLFWAACIILTARFVCHVLPDRRLRRIDHLSADPEEPTPWRRERGESHEMLELYSRSAALFEREIAILGCRVQSPFLELRRAAFAAFSVAENISQIPAFLEAKAASLNDRLQASLSMTRYLIWAIPTLGFVGTVVGIGASLERTTELQSVEPLTVAIAKNAVSTSIGVAFDTTFVALVLSLLAMLFYHSVQGLEEMNVVSRKDEAIDDLTHLDNVRPFRCEASTMARSLERLQVTAGLLARQLDRLPAAPAAVPGAGEPPTGRQRRRKQRGVLAAVVVVTLLAALATAWHTGLFGAWLAVLR